MKLRTVRGNPYPRRCACGCRSEILVGNDVRVVVDLDTSRPRKNYLPAHSPDAGSWRAEVAHVPAEIEQKSVALSPSGPASVESGDVRDVAQTCSCGCGQGIPRDPEIRYVVDFGAAKPYPTYLREHSPDFGSYRGRPRVRADVASLPGFVTASTLPRAPPAPPKPTLEPTAEHGEVESTPSPEAGRPWAFGQLVFNAGQFESARSGFADYAKDGETAEKLRARVNRIILEDIEQKVLALRALHEKLRDVTAGPSLGDVVARSRPA